MDSKRKNLLSAENALAAPNGRPPNPDVQKIQQHDFSLRPAQLAFTRNALVRLGRMFDPILKLVAGSWRSFRHHVRSARCIDRSTGSGMKFHVVTDRKLVGHCLDPDCRLVTATLGRRTVAGDEARQLGGLLAFQKFRGQLLSNPSYFRL